MKARHNTICQACRKPILVGMDIRLLFRGGPWMHKVCRRKPKQLKLF